MKKFLDQSAEVEVANPVFRAVVEEGGLESLPMHLREQGLSTERAFVITDTNVNRLYGKSMKHLLGSAGIDSTFMVMQAGEEHKTLDQVALFINQLSEAGANRNDTVIAFGGGVVGDLGAFVASIYNRGVELVQVPTTILAMVDSAIGGKTGVDHGGKNKTGSFYQPRLILEDPALLKTLDPRVYTEGFGEIAKYAILDAEFLPELEAVADDIKTYSDDNLDILGGIIARCVEQKTNVIVKDPHEKLSDGRILLNYGHTLGHGLEGAGNYTELLHGEGVSIGMNFAAQLAVKLGLADSQFVERQANLLHSLGLPTRYTGDSTTVEILKHMSKDKKNTGSASVRFVLPRAAGRMVAEQVTSSIVGRSVNDFITTGEI